jgi:hypothetical protein
MQARQNQLPGTRLPLAGMAGASAELLCHAADADVRAAAFGVPALTAAAAAAAASAGGGSGAAGGRAARWSILKQVVARAGVAFKRAGASGTKRASTFLA